MNHAFACGAADDSTTVCRSGLAWPGRSEHLPRNFRMAFHASTSTHHLPAHIIAGGLAMVVGAVALVASRGATLHRKSGLLFVYAMLIMGLNPGLALAHLHHSLNGVPSFMMFFMATITVLAAVDDVRMLRLGSLAGAPRLARHLWRMCFALFIGAGFFFDSRAGCKNSSRIFYDPLNAGAPCVVDFRGNDLLAMACPCTKQAAACRTAGPCCAGVVSFATSNSALKARQREVKRRALIGPPLCPNPPAAALYNSFADRQP